MAETLFIKNMVCPRCISTVTHLFHSMNLTPSQINLGEVLLDEKISDSEKEALNTQLKTAGFELLEPGKSSLIAQIKAAIIEQIHYSKEALKVNFSTFLSEKLNHDYAYLSRLFSSVEGITIEKYITAQKIERVKELLCYDEKTLSEIAWLMDYSSVAHLSAQFKKETGMTPTAFKNEKFSSRKMLNDI